MDFKQLLKWTILTGIWTVPFVPFIISTGMFFPFITGKNFTFRIIIELILAAWLILALWDKTYISRRSWISVSVLVFTLVIGVATILSENPYKSFWSNFERMDGYITILHMFAYFTIIGSMLRTERIWNWFFGTSVFASVLMCLYGLKQLADATGAIRVDATLGNAIYMAGYTLFHVFLTLFLMYRFAAAEKFKNLWLTFTFWLLSAVVVLQTIILYKTATRGTTLGLIGGLILTALIIAVYERKNIVLKRISLGVVVFIIVLVVGFISIKNTNYVKNNWILSRFAVISFSDIKTQARSMIWPMAVKGSFERPFFGWGQESFNYVFNKNYDPRMYAQEQWFDRTHNVVLDWLVAGGWLGLLSYLSIYFACLYLIWKGKWSAWKSRLYFWRHNEDDSLATDSQLIKGKNKETIVQGFTLVEKAILTGLLAGYFFHNLFVFDNIASYILFFTLLAYLHIQTTEDVWPNIRGIKDFDLQEWTMQGVVVPVVTIVLIFVVYYANIIPINANHALIQAMQIAQVSPEKSITLFDQAIKMNSFGNPEIREQLTSAVIGWIQNSKLDQPFKINAVNFAYSEWKKQVAMTPNDTRAYIFTTYLLSGVGAYDEVVPYITMAEKLSPRKQTVLIEAVNNLLALGKNKEALDEAKRMYDLEHSYLDGKMIYIAVLIMNKDLATAEKLISENDSAQIVGDRRIVQTATNIGATDWLKKMTEKYSVKK